MKQAMSGYKRGLDLAVLQEREQGGLTCGYELFRRINNLLGVTTRAEALSLREAVMRLDVNGLKQLGCPSAGSVKNPLDTCLFLTQEFARLRDQCAAFADLQMMEVDQIMVMMRCLPQEIHRHLAFHGKSSTLRELMESLEFYEQQSKALDFSRDSHKGNPVGYDRPPKGSPKGGKDRTPKGEGKGKEIRCRRCGQPGHVEKDCWSKSPKRTDEDKGKGKGNEKGGKPKGGKDRSHSPYDPKKKGNPKGGKPKGGKGEPKGGKGPKGGKPKGARASVGEEDEEDILGMGCVLDMTVPPEILLNQLHSYGNRLTTSSVADTDATDRHFLVDSGASIHLISQSLVDEGYLQICREWAVNERCTTANGQEMILNRCVEAEFSTHALKSRHVSFLDCDGAAASSPCAASPVAASSRAAAPSPAAPASSSLSPVSRSICAGSQLQRPQKLRVTGLIGYGQVSLLSVALLASRGWTFSCSPGKSCSRTSREVDKPAKPPCLSLSHFGGHDQVPNRTKSSRTHLDIFLWCNVPWISIVHPGVIDIDMSSSLHSLHYTSDVEPSSHRVVRYSTMHEAVQDSVLHVAEREGSSSVHERIDCADPVQPRFRRVEHAFGCLGRYHGVERREEERTESGHGHGRTDRTSARHCDRSSRATGCGKGSIGTERRDAESCPCHDGTRGEYRSDRETSRTGTRGEYRSCREAIRTSREGKGIGDGKTGIRSSEGSSRARDPREAFCRDGESSGGDVRAGSDVSNESLVKLASSTRSEGRGEADQKSRQAASAETAAPVGSDCRPSTSSSKRTITATVLDRDGGRPTTEGVSPEGVEASHQSPATRADCKAAIDRERGSGLQSHSQGRVHDPKQASRLDRSQSASAAEVIGISCEKGVYRDPAPKGSHDGEPDRFGSLRCWRPGRDSRSSSRECSDSDQRSKEHFVRLNRPRADNIRNSGAYKRGRTGTSIGATTGHKAWNRLLHEEKARGAGEREVHVPGPSVVATFEQHRVVGHGCLHFWIGSSRSSSPDLDRREFTASRNSRKDPEANPILAANEGEGQTGGTPTPTGSTPGVAGSSGRQTGGDGRSGSCQAEGASESGKRRSGENVGSDCPDGNSGAENSIGSGTKNATDTTDETQSEIATAHRRAKSGGRRGVSSKSQRPPQGSRPQEVPGPSKRRKCPRHQDQVQREYRSTWHI